MPIIPNNPLSNGMLNFFGLCELPFGVAPDPRFLYPSPQHREALTSLSFGIENQVGIAALIGEPGLGKTTLLFDLLQRYNNRASTAFIFNTLCNGPELLRQIVVELQVPGTDRETDPIRLHELFTAFVARKMRDKPVVIVIDEAQNLENTALETLRLLSNFEAADHKLLHIILSGQPQLAEKLRHPNLTQVLQRITMVNRLTRLSRQEIEECISFRLQVAGYDGKQLFTAQALDRITSGSAGVPREFNRICINALQRAYSNRRRLIDVDLIDDVLSDLTLSERLLGGEPPLAEMPQPVEPSGSTHFRVGTSISSHAEEQSDPLSSPEPEQPEESPLSTATEADPEIVTASIEEELERPLYRPLPVRKSLQATPPPARDDSATGISAAAEGRPSPEPSVLSPENEMARRQEEAYRERQKALLRAAAQRRMAAERRLKALRGRMEDGAVASHAGFSYQGGVVLDGNGDTRQGGLAASTSAQSATRSFNGESGSTESGRHSDTGGNKRTGT
jgi:general secretion pathway protein A